MKILVMSASPWNGNNSFGNSFSNIFSGLENVEIANIVCSRLMEPTDEPKVTQSFFITTKMLIENLKNPGKKVGTSVYHEPAAKAADNMEKGSLSKFVKKRRWMIFFWLRDMVWNTGRWKSKELLKFIEDFDPDLIFQPVYFSSYLNDIVSYIKKHTNAPMIGYISDDNYTLRQFRFSPFFWIDRLYKRRKVKNTIEQCELLYVISQIQKDEYEKIFTPPCKILTKCADFGGDEPKYEVNNGALKLIYAGNLSKGRQKSLCMIASAVERLNAEGYPMELDIYTGAILDEKVQDKLNNNVSKVHKPVPYREILEIQKSADILVHVEGLSIKERCSVHQSFSTKLVDFFEFGKCIFAIGTYDMGFAKHLIDNNAAVVATSEKEVYEKLKSLVHNRELIADYGKKAWNCGKNNHEKTEMQRMLIEDMKKVVEK